MRKILFSILILSTGINAEKIEQTGSIKEMNVSCGTEEDSIEITWKDCGSASYIIYRSLYKNSGFQKIAEVNALFLSDNSCEKGTRYWYKVLPVDIDDSKFLINREEYESVNESGCNLELFPTIKEKTVVASEISNNDEVVSKNEKVILENEKESKDKINPDADNVQEGFNYSGYRKIIQPTGIILDSMIKSKTESEKSIKNISEKNNYQRRKAYLSKYYMNSIKLSLIINVAKPYIKRGDLRVFADFKTNLRNEDEKKVVLFSEKYDYAVVFESPKLFRIIKESGDPELGDILLRNAECFCIYSSDKIFTDENGLNRIIPVFDAVGLTTRIIKNDRDWKKNTIMLSTSREDLKKKMRDASRN